MFKPVCIWGKTVALEIMQKLSDTAKSLIYREGILNPFVISKCNAWAWVWADWVRCYDRSKASNKAKSYDDIIKISKYNRQHFGSTSMKFTLVICFLSETFPQLS